MELEHRTSKSTSIVMHFLHQGQTHSNKTPAPNSATFHGPVIFKPPHQVNWYRDFQLSSYPVRRKLYAEATPRKILCFSVLTLVLQIGRAGGAKLYAMVHGQIAPFSCSQMDGSVRKEVPPLESTALQVYSSFSSELSDSTPQGTGIVLYFIFHYNFFQACG